MSLQSNERSSSDDDFIENAAIGSAAVIDGESTNIDSITCHTQNEKLSIDNSIDAAAALGSIHEEETASTNTTQTTEKQDLQVAIKRQQLHIILGRWVLVNSEVSTRMVKVIRGEMLITPLGDDGYTLQDTWMDSICCCYRRTYKTTSIGRITGLDTFTETNVKTGKVEYGRMDGNKHIVVGDQVYTLEFVGDICYLKVVDASCSLYITAEYERIPFDTKKI